MHDRQLVAQVDDIDGSDRVPLAGARQTGQEHSSLRTRLQRVSRSPAELGEGVETGQQVRHHRQRKSLGKRRTHSVRIDDQRRLASCSEGHPQCQSDIERHIIPDHGGHPPLGRRIA